MGILESAPSVPMGNSFGPSLHDALLWAANAPELLLLPADFESGSGSTRWLTSSRSPGSFWPGGSGFPCRSCDTPWQLRVELDCVPQVFDLPFSLLQKGTRTPKLTVAEHLAGLTVSLNAGRRWQLWWRLPRGVTGMTQCCHFVQVLLVRKAPSQTFIDQIPASWGQHRVPTPPSQHCPLLLSLKNLQLGLMIEICSVDNDPPKTPKS